MNYEITDDSIHIHNFFNILLLIHLFYRSNQTVFVYITYIGFRIIKYIAIAVIRIIGIN